MTLGYCCRNCDLGRPCIWKDGQIQPPKEPLVETVVALKCRCGAEYFPLLGVDVHVDGTIVRKICPSCIHAERTVLERFRDTEGFLDSMIGDAIKYGWTEEATIAFEAKSKVSLLRLKRRMRL